MLGLTTDRRGPMTRMADEARRGRAYLTGYRRDEGPPVGWIVAGVVAVGLGYLAWTYLAPDVRRYMKIHSM